MTTAAERKVLVSDFFSPSRSLLCLKEECVNFIFGRRRNLNGFCVMNTMSELRPSAASCVSAPRNSLKPLTLLEVKRVLLITLLSALVSPIYFLFFLSVDPRPILLQ